MKITTVEPLLIDRYMFVQVHTDAGISGLGESGAWGYLEASEAVVKKLGALSGRRRPAADRAPLAVHVPLEPLPRGGDHGRAQRHRHRALGHRGQALRRAGLSAARRQGARQGASLLPRLRATRPRSWSRDAWKRKRPASRRSATSRRSWMRTAMSRTRRRTSPRCATPSTPFGSTARRSATTSTSASRSTAGSRPHEAIVLARGIEQFHPFFYEDPILPDNFDMMGLVAENIHIPIATGERLHTIYEFEMLLARNAVQYVRPDVCMCGGITGAKKIAALAEARHVGVVPHNPLSPVSTAACIQIAAAHAELRPPGVPDRRGRPAEERDRADGGQQRAGLPDHPRCARHRHRAGPDARRSTPTGCAGWGRACTWTARWSTSDRVTE